MMTMTDYFYVFRIRYDDDDNEDDESKRGDLIKCKLNNQDDNNILNYRNTALKISLH